ncbi:MAG: hypothetical protein HYS67_08715 [Deltaproteobacteria bacterium]|nr:hypothetical protein [Deltaproteobacteria bacterium]MBI2539205.1 hypothetical protein [Deltaproteobacteria bacterium]MBI3062984.1 hypothetical protein [Deltaproteobacteria bacterium]
MTDQLVRAYGSAKGFHQQTLDRWLGLSEVDRAALLDLAQGLKLGENHFRDFLDWLEEIALRDGLSFRDVLDGAALARISSDPRLGRGDKLKRMKEELRRLRFPRLARLEDEIQRRVQEMKLGPLIQISFPPGLEGGELTVQIKAASHAELEKSARELAESLEKKAMKEIFELLSGRGI